VVQPGVKSLVKIVGSEYVDCGLEVDGRDCSEPKILFPTISEETRGLVI
jgi:hypothetical protein